METWLCVDCNFGENDKKDQSIIQNWNEIVDDKDTVIIAGNFFIDDIEPEKAEELIKKLKGDKRICNFQDNNTKLTKNFYENLNIKTYDMIGYCWPDQNIWLIPLKVSLFTAKKYRKESKFVAAQSVLDQEEIYKDGFMSISMSHWGYAPLKYSSIPTLFNNLVDFDKLEAR